MMLSDVVTAHASIPFGRRSRDCRRPLPAPHATWNDRADLSTGLRRAALSQTYTPYQINPCALAPQRLWRQRCEFGRYQRAGPLRPRSPARRRNLPTITDRLRTISYRPPSDSLAEFVFNID